MEKFKKSVREILSEKQSQFNEICNFIFENPELGEEEFVSSRYLAEQLEKEGFTVTFPYENLPTAFIAEYRPKRNVSCTAAFLAEYDALPGYGEKGEPGHACGHNWIAAAMCGCGIVLSNFADQLGCCVKVIGTPAEESLGAKCDMGEAGAFDDVDFAMQAHLADVTCLETKTLAMSTIEFTFRGKATHAAQTPEQGINALDGVILTFNGINALRQHVRNDARIHGIITEGGEAPNIVPDFAQCKISVRTLDRDYLAEVREKILHIAQGAALMTGAEFTYAFCENTCYDMKNNRVLVDTVQKNLEAAGISDFLPGEKYLSPGSSDIGNVSYLCSTLYFEVDPEGEKTCIIHDPAALEIVNSEAAYRKMSQVIEGFVMASLEIAGNSALLAEIKREFDKDVHGKA